MDRNREVRRGCMPAANGLSRRRHRSSSLRDSPEEDGPVELHETVRLRDRGNKKERDRDRSTRNKRRRGDRLMHGSNREEGGEDSTEESMDEEEEDEDEDSGALRMLTANPPSSSSLSNHHHQRKSFPPAKVVRAAPTWKVADEMIGVSVPRKARTASAKRAHECWMSSSIASGSGAEQIPRQASTSPSRLNASAPSPAPISPSTSNISVRKKMKTIGPKHRPPKMSKPSSSNQEDIEIEVAGVLYELMRQSQCPPKQEILANANASQKLDSKETNGSSNEVRSRVSSPVSISPPAAAQQPSVLPQNSSTSITLLPVVAPKRKRPRPVKLEEESPVNVSGRNGSISSAPAKVENEQPAKSEASSPKSEKNSGSASQKSGASVDLGSQPTAAVSSSEPPQSEPLKAESNTASAPKPFTEESETRDGVQTREEVPLPRKESPPCAKLDVDLEDAIATKTVSTASEVECKREDKFEIDLMAPPPLKSSPERDGDMEYVSDSKAMALDVDMVPKAEAPVTAEEKTEEITKQDDAVEGQLEEKKTEPIVEGFESEKPLANKERILDLQLDLEKPDKDGATGSVSGSKQQQPLLSQAQKQPQQQPPKATTSTRNDPKLDKTAQPTSLPVPMTLAGWPGGLPSLGYMPPLQAVVSMDGSSGPTTAVQPPHFLLSQPRPKRCATHYYIARNIDYNQHFTRINPFWPPAAGSASMYGAKPYNLNVVPPTESTILGNPLQGSFAGRSSVPEKVQASSTISGHNAKDKSSAPVAASLMDATQRKQIVLQQAQPAAAGNLLHGPAFIFPLSQQQQHAAAAAAASRVGTLKTGVTPGNAALPVAANSGPVAPACSSSATAGMATTVSFNYPNLPANEAQYLAILQNNGCPFPIPAHVGAPYRGGSPAQAMSFFNGSFYSPQMIHSSQLQQQAQQQQTHSQLQPGQQGHQNTTTSSGSSSSHKHQQAQQQQRLQGGGNNAVVGNSYNFPASKNRLPMQQQQQQQQNHLVPTPHQSRQHEAEGVGEDSPSTADSRASHARKSIYGQNFAVPIHPQNYAMMSPAALGGGGSGNHGEKHPQQQQSTKGGVELLQSQAFAMSFATFNGAATAPSFDFLAQNQAIYQTPPEAARQSYKIAAAAQAAQQKKNHHVSEEGKTSGDSINVEDERKGTVGKAPAQSLAFSRPDSNDPSVSTVLGNSVIDSSARTLNLISAPINGNRAARPTTSTSTSSTAAPASSPSTQHQQLMQLQKQQQQQMQHQHQQQQQMQHQQQQQMQHQHQQQQQQKMQQQMQQHLAAVARSKTPASNNVCIYPDRIPSSSSMAAKFPNGLPVFSQALIQSSSPSQSPQWKNSARTTGSPAPSPSLASTSTSSMKNLPQQQSRTQQGQTHISFGVNQKPATAPQGQQIPMNSSQSPSPPVVVGSPPSSISKGAGSPRTSSTGGGKAGSSPALPSQQSKNSPSGPSRKSSPVGGRNVPSILSNSHIGAALSSGGKSQSQVQQQQQQQQLQKQSLQQPQIFFTNAYVQAPSPQAVTNITTTTSNSATTGYYHQRRQQSDQQQGASTASSSGMLALCSPSLTLAGASTSDPAKAVAAAAAANGMKGMPPSGLLHAAQFAAQTAGTSHQLISAGFPYIHVPTVSVKPAEQKQPAGNDNLHACWQPEKR